MHEFAMQQQRWETMSIFSKYIEAKKRGFDRSLPLKTREQELVRAMDLRNQAGQPSKIDSGWVGDPKNEPVDVIERELERVRRYIDNGNEYDPRFRTA